jgi:hypothetical protein
VELGLLKRAQLRIPWHKPKAYIQDSSDSDVVDITPLRATSTIGSNAFTTTDTSTTVVLNDTAHGAQNGDFIVISGVSGAVNGIPDTDLNTEFRVTYIDANTFSIEVATPATSSGTTGACVIAYQITTGSAIYTTAAGWGAGGWSGVTTGFASTGWGESAATGVGVDLRLWSQINYGEYLLANDRGGAIYLWAPATSPSTVYRAQVLSSSNANTQDSIAYWTTDSSCPSACNIVHVSDSSRFVIAFGCNDYGVPEINPLLYVGQIKKTTLRGLQPLLTKPVVSRCLRAPRLWLLSPSVKKSWCLQMPPCTPCSTLAPRTCGVSSRWVRTFPS